MKIDRLEFNDSNTEIILSSGTIYSPDGETSSMITNPKCSLISAGTGILGGYINSIAEGDILNVSPISITEVKDNTQMEFKRTFQALAQIILELGGIIGPPNQSLTHEQQIAELVFTLDQLGGSIYDEQVPFLPKSTYTFDASLGFKGNFKVECETSSNLNMYQFLVLLSGNQIKNYSILNF